MLMNSQYDGYVFGQVAAPQQRRTLARAARGGNRTAQAIVRAQNQLGDFGDDEEQGSGIKTGGAEDYSTYDPNGWPPTTDAQPPPPPPPPAPADGSGFSLKDLKGVGKDVVTGVGDAADTYNKVKAAVSPVAGQVASPAAVAASTPAGNVGAANPTRIANAVAAFRNSVAAFISDPSASTFNVAVIAWHTALDAYSDDTGSPPSSTASVIALINAALMKAASQYADMYDYLVQLNAQKTGGALQLTRASPIVAQLATRTLRAGGPTAAEVANIAAKAGINTTANTPPASGSGFGAGTIALVLGAAYFILK